jgi:hypothetical protein
MPVSHYFHPVTAAASRSGRGLADPAHQVALWVAQMEVGDPFRLGRLGVISLHLGHEPSTPPSPAFSLDRKHVTLQEGLVSGSAQVTAAPIHGGSVLLANRGAQPVLVLAGDELPGVLDGPACRIVRETVLVPPRCTLALAVRCTEPLPSVSVLPALPAPQAPSALPEDLGPVVGVVALIRGRAHRADLFDRTETLRAYWPRLLHTYATDAMAYDTQLSADPSAPDAPPASDAPCASGNPRAAEAMPSRASAQRFLCRALLAERIASPSVGLGTRVQIHGQGITGTSLVYRGTVVHTSLVRRRVTCVGPAQSMPMQ